MASVAGIGLRAGCAPGADAPVVGLRRGGRLRIGADRRADHESGRRDPAGELDRYVVGPQVDAGRISTTLAGSPPPSTVSVVYGKLSAIFRSAVDDHHM